MKILNTPLTPAQLAEVRSSRSFCAGVPSVSAAPGNTRNFRRYLAKLERKRAGGAV